MEKGKIRTFIGEKKNIIRNSIVGVVALAVTYPGFFLLARKISHNIAPKIKFNLEAQRVFDEEKVKIGLRRTDISLHIYNNDGLREVTPSLVAYSARLREDSEDGEKPRYVVGINKSELSTRCMRNRLSYIALRVLDEGLPLESVSIKDVKERYNSKKLFETEIRDLYINYPIGVIYELTGIQF